MNETLVAKRERARLRRVMDPARRGSRETTEAREARPDTGWVMSDDGVIGAPAEDDD